MLRPLFNKMVQEHAYTKEKSSAKISTEIGLKVDVSQRKSIKNLNSTVAVLKSSIFRGLIDVR